LNCGDICTASAAELSAGSAKLSRFGQAIWISGSPAINFFVKVRIIGYNPLNFAKHKSHITAKLVAASAPSSRRKSYEEPA